MEGLTQICFLYWFLNFCLFLLEDHTKCWALDLPEVIWFYVLFCFLKLTYQLFSFKLEGCLEEMTCYINQKSGRVVPAGWNSWVSNFFFLGLSVKSGSRPPLIGVG